MKIHLRSFHFAAMLLLFAGIISAGEAIPFQSPLTSQSDFDRWTALDIDGNIEGEKATWYLGNTDCGGTCATSYTDVSTFKPTDNRLVSPAITLTASQPYVVNFQYYTAYYMEEHLAVYLSTTPTIADDATPVADLLIRNYYGGKQSVMLPEITESGDYYITLRHYSSGPEGMLIGIKDFVVDVLKDGSAEGKVTTYIDGTSTPVEGVKITFTGPNTYTAVTDAEGFYRFEALPAADYVVTYTKFGFEEDSYPRTVTVNASETLIHNISIFEMWKTALKGHVTDYAGNPLPGARVRLEGYADYSGTTDAEGNFTISDVYLYKGYYGSSDYRMTIAKNGFTTVEKTQPMKYDYYSDHNKADDVALAYKGIAPHKAYAAENADGTADVTWTYPTDITPLIFDNNEPGSPMGYESGREQNILGTVFRTPMNITSVSWYRMSSEYEAATPPAEVILYIISLDNEGNPDPTNFLYTNSAIPSAIDTWTTFELPETIEAPNGCLIALSALGYVSLARDNNSEPAPAGTQLYSTTYNGGYKYFEDSNWTGAWMLRASGEIMESGDFSPELAYNVYRFEESKAADQSAWTNIAEAVTTTAYTDNEFASIPRGSYQYAVEAVYGGNIISERTVTETVHKAQHTTLSVAVTADSAPGDAEGATVKLDDGTNSYTATVIDGTAEFEKIWKSTYGVTVTLNGFECDATTFDLSDAPSYTKSLTIRQIIRPVRNIDIIETNEGLTLAWDLFADIFDDFDGEDHNDFEINPAGAIGWQYIDNDALPTYGFGSTSFPGMREPMAAILFNGNNTVPPLGINPAYSGDRCLAFFAAYPTESGGGLILNKSDDYLISPLLSYHKDFKFSFRAKTYEIQDGRFETIRVGYSTTTPEVDAFIWLTDGYVPVPDNEHSLFEFEIPADARYVAINSHSDDVFMLSVDDISMTTGITHSYEPASVGSFIGYNVYIDGELKKTLTENSWVLPQLPDGVHTAEVSKIYNGGESERMAIDFGSVSGIENVQTGDVLITMLRNRRMRISGDYESATIWSADGIMVAQGITGNDIVELDTLPGGIYIVMATTKTGPVTKKIAL